MHRQEPKTFSVVDTNICCSVEGNGLWFLRDVIQQTSLPYPIVGIFTGWLKRASMYLSKFLQRAVMLTDLKTIFFLNDAYLWVTKIHIWAGCMGGKGESIASCSHVWCWARTRSFRSVSCFQSVWSVRWCRSSWPVQRGWRNVADKKMFFFSFWGTASSVRWSMHASSCCPSPMFATPRGMNH